MTITVQLEGNGDFRFVFAAPAPFACSFPAEKCFIHFNGTAETVQVLAFSHGTADLVQEHLGSF